MVILICINNLTLSQGLRALIGEHVPDAIVSADSCGTIPDKPDIVLFESRLKARELRNSFPHSRFICLDLGMKDSELACMFYCHGVHGIISPNLDVNMFCKALRTVYAGEIWAEQTHIKALLREGRSLPMNGGLPGVSAQDRSIIDMVVGGLKNREIAAQLCLSEATIKTHLSRIYKTLRVNNRSSLVALASEGVLAN